MTSRKTSHLDGKKKKKTKQSRNLKEIKSQELVGEENNSPKVLHHNPNESKKLPQIKTLKTREVFQQIKEMENSKIVFLCSKVF